MKHQNQRTWTPDPRTIFFWRIKGPWTIQRLLRKRPGGGITHLLILSHFPYYQIHISNTFLRLKSWSSQARATSCCPLTILPMLSNCSTTRANDEAVTTFWDHFHRSILFSIKKASRLSNWVKKPTKFKVATLCIVICFFWYIQTIFWKKGICIKNKKRRTFCTFFCSSHCVYHRYSITKVWAACAEVSAMCGRSTDLG